MQKDDKIMPETHTPASAPENAPRAVADWKRRLLDTSARNPLLSLPDDLIDLPDAGEIFNLLVHRRKSVDLWDARHPDLDRAVLRLPANYTLGRTPLDTLRRLHLRIASLLEGQDINVLYGAFGVLRWRVGDEVLRSPLLLIPLTLERHEKGDGFTLHRMDEDVEVNPVLRERLLSLGTGEVLPAPPEENYLVAAGYLRDVAERIESRDGWSVEEGGFLAALPLLKMRLYEDLAALAPRAHAHLFVQTLAGDTVENDAPLETSLGTLPLDNLLDADPAQEAAIMAAAQGHSFVLQGPPGTGKTQTIANIIGERVASGKSVLLVSGRMASLESVHQRLSDKGLGGLCLLAHSLKTGKRDILAQLEQSLAAPAPRRGKETKEQAEWAGLGDTLDTVAQELHVRREPLGLSLYEAQSKMATLCRGDEATFAFPAPLAIDAAGLAEREAAVRDFATGGRGAAPTDAPPSLWDGAFRNPDDPDLPAELSRAIEGIWETTAHLTGQAAEFLGQYGLALPEVAGFAQVEQARLVAAELNDTPSPLCLEPTWLATQTPAAVREIAALLQQKYCAAEERRRRLEAEFSQLTQDYSPDILFVPHDALVDRLAIRHDLLLREVFGDSWQGYVAKHHEKIEATLGNIARDTEQLEAALSEIAIICGLPVGDEATGRNRMLRAARLAARLPAPHPAWFAAENTPEVVTAQLDEAIGQMRRLERLTGELYTIYTDAILALDHPALLQTVGANVSGVARLLNPAIARDTKAIRATMRPGISGKERDLSADLLLAQEARALQTWFADNNDRLASLFGPLYSGQATDWDTLREALAQAAALRAEFPERGGLVPPGLLQRMHTGADAQQDLENRHAGVGALFATLRTDWDKLLLLVPPLRANALPSRQDGFALIATWCNERREAVSDFAAAVKKASALRVLPNAPLRFDDLIDDLVVAKEMRQEQAEIEIERNAVVALRDPCTGDTHVPVPDVVAALDKVARIQTLIGVDSPLTAPLIALLGKPLSDRRDFADAVASLTSGAALLRQHLATGRGLLAADHFVINGADVKKAPFSAIAAWVEARRERRHEIAPAQQKQLHQQGHVSLGLEDFFVRCKGQDPDEAVRVFLVGFYRQWGEAVTYALPALQRFDAVAHAARIAKFRVLDRAQMDTAAGRIHEVAATYRSRAQKLWPDEVKTLKGQLARRRTGEVRKLLAQIPHLLTALKPCVLMNPLSVRLFLDGDALHFDTVIFDDASQIATEDAIAAIVRGTQVIIAGDQKQLPPQSPLPRAGDAASEGFESILDVAGAIARAGSARFGFHTLNWHYRSRNEGLIAFSRRYFYPDLISFPSAQVGGAIEYIEADAADTETTTETPDAATPHAGGAAVVEALRQYTRKYPQHTAGVVVLTEEDQARIGEAIAGAGGDITEGSVFVRTIDNVQGDECDMVLLYVAHAGACAPLQATSGERLLNVATTRARHHILVVNTQPALRDPAPGDEPMGLALLRAFLRYAAGGEDMEPSAASEVAPDAFVTLIESALMAKGYGVRRQVGQSQYRVDLAVLDSKQPDRFLLGIGCDGPGYAASPHARHRDRLLDEMLAQRGWSRYRAWSADWSADPAGAVARLVTAVEAAAPVK